MFISNVIAILFLIKLCYSDISLRMPSVQITSNDQYTCSHFKYPSDFAEIEYITEFIPRVNKSVVHHMILGGCTGEITDESELTCFSHCEKIIYVWAHQAPELKLPSDTGFRIGSSSDIKFLQLQMHYKTPSRERDSSGLDLITTSKKLRYSAGIYLLAAPTYGKIPPHTPNATLDISCQLETNSEIVIFAIRTHAHSLGRAVVGYYIDENNVPVLMGRGNPQLPQAFYAPKLLGSETNEIKLGNEDVVMARCVYNSMNRKRVTYIGGTQEDEMCNLYLMYYSDSESLNGLNDVCIGNNVPDAWRLAPKDASKYGPETLEPQTVKDANVEEEKIFSVPITPKKTLYFEQVKDWSLTGVPFKIGQISSIDYYLDPTTKEKSLLVLQRGDNPWDSGSFSITYNYLKDTKATVNYPMLMVNPESGIIKGYALEKQLLLPHSITIEKTNDEFPLAVWITDVALHQAFKYEWNSWDQPSLILGTRGVPGDDDKHFCQPADVKISKNKDAVFVADGYCNSRVVKYSKNGTRLTEWGLYGTNNSGYERIGEFKIVHNLFIVEDHKDSVDQICAIDRENARFLCYSFEGKLLDAYTNKEFKPSLFSMTFNEKDNLLYGVNGPLFSGSATKGATFEEPKILVMKMNSVRSGRRPQLLSSLEEGSIENNKNLLGSFGYEAKAPEKAVLSNPHSIMSSLDNAELYIADIFRDNLIIKFSISENKTFVHPEASYLEGLRASAMNSIKSAARRPKIIGVFLLCVCGALFCVVFFIFICRYNSSRQKELREFYELDSSTVLNHRPKREDNITRKKNTFKENLFGDRWRKKQISKAGFEALSTSEKDALIQYSDSDEDSEDEVVNTNRLPKMNFQYNKDSSTII